MDDIKRTVPSITQITVEGDGSTMIFSHHIPSHIYWDILCVGYRIYTFDKDDKLIIISEDDTQHQTVVKWNQSHFFIEPPLPKGYFAQVDFYHDKVKSIPINPI